MHRFASLALVLSLTVPAAAPAQTPDAASLLALHHRYVGWQLGDNTVSSIRTECVVTTSGGNESAHVAEQRMGMAFRDDIVLDQGTYANGFTGSLFWRTSSSGFTTPTIGIDNKASLALDVVFAEGTTELSATDTGTAQIDGKTYDVLRTSMNDEPIDLYVDPATGAYRRAVVEPGGDQQITLDIDAYAEAAPGIRIISAYHIAESNGVEQYTCPSAHINMGVTLTSLRPPTPTATWTFTNDQPVPIHISHHQVIIDAQVNGVPGQFVLDTGSSAILLTDAFAARAHLSEAGPGTVGAVSASRSAQAGQAYGIGGTATIHFTQAQTITVAGNTLSNVAVTTINKDMTELQTPTEPLQHIDGLFGFDFLAGALVDVNLGNNTLRIRDPIVQPDPNAGMLLVVDLSNGVPVVPMTIDGSVEAYATLDSGFDGSVFFARDLIWNYGLKIAYDDTGQNVFTQYAIVSGIGGIVAERCGHLDSVALGPINYRFMQACESRDLHGRNIVVGWDFIKHFNYVFDYPRAVIQIVPNGNQQE